jgi:prepilin-type processing-associated H-X9-DG protein
MKTSLRNSRALAFTLKDLLVVLVVVGLLACLLLPWLVRARTRSRGICCNCNLKQIGLSFKQWGLDHNGKFPMQTSITNGGTMELVENATVFPHFLVLSNELNTPIILACPSDTARRAARIFDSTLGNSNLSYFVGVDADDANPQMFLAGDRNITNRLGLRSGLVAWATNELVGWTHQLHNQQGNVALADGSVQGFSNSRLREALQNTGVVTNRLLLP